MSLAAQRKQTNKMLNYVDFVVFLSAVLLIIILFQAANCFDFAPLLTVNFILQAVFYYLNFRVKYAVPNLPFMWCSSCSERRHIRFHFWNAFFAGFVILCDLLDIFRSAISKNGLF